MKDGNKKQGDVDEKKKEEVEEDEDEHFDDWHGVRRPGEKSEDE